MFSLSFLASLLSLSLSLSVFFLSTSLAKQVTLSNTQLPRDTRGAELLTGEASFMYAAREQLFFAYFNNWGGCAGVDCCPSAQGCASCCFNPPSPAYPDACVYTDNHSVVAYSTPDFQTWTFEGEVLGLGDRLPGIEFRPQVIYSPPLQLYLMWYEDRWRNGTNRGYAINAAPSPRGPFRPYAASVMLPGSGRVGDYDLFEDDDGTAYHVRTGLTIVQLNASRTGPTGKYGSIPEPDVEGPAMFKRDGVYFILAGVGCCACRGGSNIRVYTSTTSPLGPYTYQGDVGSRTDRPFDRHSPSNYVTQAQQTKVLPIPTSARSSSSTSPDSFSSLSSSLSSSASVQYLWVGNQWVTSAQPGHPRNNDLLYWSLLRFSNATSIAQLVYSDECVLEVG